MPTEVIIIGPIAAKGEAAVGGYEAANRRTADALGNLGYNVSTFPYKQPNQKGLFAYTTGIYQIVRKLLSSRHNKETTFIHLTALYKQFVYLEIWLLLISKWLGFKFIYDVRAGSVFMHYHQRSFIYRATFKFIVKHADLLLCEGEIFIEQFLSIGSITPKYFPNFVDKSIDYKTKEKPGDVVKLVYFGRLNREKGIIKIIETCYYLNQKNVNCELTLIGSSDRLFRSEMTEIISMLNIANKVIITRPLPKKALNKVLSSQHFFIFPTAHKGEGHSNALTEAMSIGLVPVCSNHGFNASVVSDTGVILSKDSSAQDYGEAILKIVDQGLWETLAKRAIERVDKNFLEGPVIERLVSYYSTINQNMG